jgi:hypothetical protein
MRGILGHIFGIYQKRSEFFKIYGIFFVTTRINWHLKKKKKGQECCTKKGANPSIGFRK